MDASITSQYNGLVTRAREAAELYYNDPERSKMCDEEYDELLDLIASFEAAYPDLDTSESPTQIVGAGTPGDTRHAIPMLSLAKITDVEKAQSFVKSLNSPVLVQGKLDGVSISLEYRGGHFVRALTRGDGESGEDITETMRHLSSVVKTVGDSFTGSIRGEAVIHTDELGGKYKNARNGAAGSINHNDPTTAAKRNVRFYAFDLLSDAQEYAFADDNMVLLKQWGFAIAPTFVAKAPEEAVRKIAALLDAKDKLPYEIDGVVVKAVSMELRKTLGNRSNSPRWAFAFKRASETAQARITGLKLQVGKSGTIGLVYTIEPADLEGTTITNLTAHNFSEIKRLDVRKGDIVTIRRMGQVIPGVVCVTDPSSRTGDEVPFGKPTLCPGCGGQLTEYGTSQQLKCTSDDCLPQRVRRLSHWAGRSAADIDAIGPTWIEQFAETGLVETPADFYSITRMDLMKFDNMGDGRATKFLDSIEQSKQLGMRRTLIGFAIPQAGEGTADRLCKVFDSVEAVMDASLVQLMAVPDMGIVVATSVQEFFQRPETRALVSELRARGVNLDRAATDAPLQVGSMEGEFAGLKVCVTGSLTVSRDEFHKLLEQHGAIIAKSVSKNVALLVVGKNVGRNKTEAAKKNGTKVITEEAARSAMGLS